MRRRSLLRLWQCGLPVSAASKHRRGATGKSVNNTERRSERRTGRHRLLHHARRCRHCHTSNERRPLFHTLPFLESPWPQRYAILESRLLRRILLLLVRQWRTCSEMQLLRHSCLLIENRCGPSMMKTGAGGGCPCAGDGCCSGRGAGGPEKRAGWRGDCWGSGGEARRDRLRW